MAQVEGVTPSKVAEMTTEMGKSVISGTVDASGQLLLNTRDGAVIVAGMVGTGSGTGGADVDASVTFSFATPAATWTCVHNLGHRFVDVTTYASDGTVIVGDVSYVDDNTCTVSWYRPTAGTAFIQR